MNECVKTTGKYDWQLGRTSNSAPGHVSERALNVQTDSSGSKLQNHSKITMFYCFHVRFHKSLQNHLVHQACIRIWGLG